MYKLYGSGNASTDSLVTLDIREDDEIECVKFDILATGVTDGAAYGAELSFSSSNGHTVNDTTQSIAAAYTASELTTSGGWQTGFERTFVMGVKVKAGERLHLHLYVSGTVTAVAVRCWICTKRNGSGRPLTRSRV